VQNDFCHSDGFLGRRGIDLGPTQAMMPTLMALVDAARFAGVPVIYTANAHDEWSDARSWKVRHQDDGDALCRSGTWGAEFYAVSPQPNERIIFKHRYDAFLGTDLDLILRARGTTTLIFTGVASNVCVETTARGAFCRDYQLVLVEDCLAGSSVEAHRAALATLQSFFDAQIVRADDLAGLWRTECTPASETQASHA
jgi:ureidoacrylate peracid hydrolase